MMTDKIKTRGIFTLTFRDRHGRITRQYRMRNLIVDSGLAILASALTLDYIAVGSGTTAPAGSDTKLENETARKAVASSQSSGNKKYVSVYFGLNEANGTINEVGAFSGGSTAPNSGTLFSRISTESSELPVTKTNQESLTIDYEVEIVSV